MSHSNWAKPIFTHIAAGGLMLTMAACAGPEIFDTVGAAESPAVASAPYPRLADVTPPGPGPDPVLGDAVQIELGAAAAEAEVRRAAVSGPVR